LIPLTQHVAPLVCARPFCRITDILHGVLGARPPLPASRVVSDGFPMEVPRLSPLLFVVASGGLPWPLYGLTGAATLFTRCTSHAFPGFFLSRSIDPQVTTPDADFSFTVRSRLLTFTCSCPCCTFDCCCAFVPLDFRFCSGIVSPVSVSYP